MGLEESPMTISPTAEGTLDIPAQIFEKFLQALGETGVSAELVSRLRKTLLEDQTFTESALRAAIMGEELLS